MGNVVPLPSAALMSAAEFKVCRERLGLTASWVATQLGVYEKTISRWETGERVVSEEAANLLRLIHARTSRLIMKSIRKIKKPTTLLTYRRDEDMVTFELFSDLDLVVPLPASWHRAMTGRIALLTDQPVKIAYAEPVGSSAVP